MREDMHRCAHLHTQCYIYKLRGKKKNTFVMIERYYLWSHSASLKFSNSHDSSWEQNRLGEVRVPCLSPYPRHTVTPFSFCSSLSGGNTPSVHQPHSVGLASVSLFSPQRWSKLIVTPCASLCSMWHRYECFLQWIWSPTRQIWSCSPQDHCSESSGGFCPFLNSCELFSWKFFHFFGQVVFPTSNNFQ